MRRGDIEDPFVRALAITNAMGDGKSASQAANEPIVDGDDEDENGQR